MAHQVFLSYATEDIDSARLLCRVLEAGEGIRCWMAPRDVAAGTDYAAAILDAIKNAELVLLLFSSSTNASPYVLREIERAVGYDRPVISVRLDAAAPNPSLEYYLNMLQWLDAPRGIESRRQEIVVAVRRQLGAAPADAARSPKSGAGRLSDERRLVTILCAEFAGFTGLVESRDLDEIQELQKRCFDRLVPCVERYGGTIDKFIGDALMALFGAPVAHERDAERAIRAALDMRSCLADINRDERLDLTMHVGIDTGRVLTGSVGGGHRHAYSVIGDAVNLASRLEEMSAPSEILIGPQTYALAGSLFKTQEAGVVKVRGRTDAVQVYQVLGLADSAESKRPSSLQSLMVGREHELGVLRAALNRLSQGEGGVVCVLGDAGLGKSRLLAESRTQASPDAFNWLGGQAVSMGESSSYAPIKQILEYDAGFTAGDDAAAQIVRLERRLAALMPDDRDRLLAPLSAFLGLPVQDAAEDSFFRLVERGSRDRLQGAIVRYLKGVIHERPLVLVLDDCHWLDPSSAALVHRLLALLKEAPMLLVLAARSEVEDSPIDLEQIATEAGERGSLVRLGPLTRAESRRLVAELLGSQALAAGLQQTVERRAEGNPFFIHEIVRSLIELGSLQRDEDGTWRYTGRPDVTLPDSLEEIIMARVDRLPLEAKQMLRLASVTGRTFTQPLLLELTGSTPLEMAKTLRHLEDAELIRSAGGESHEFAFVHGLIQEAVYNGLTARERRALHTQVAEAVEALFMPDVEDYFGVLAYHYGKAENWDLAREYLVNAGARTRSTGALCEYYQAALETLLRGYTPSPDAGGDAQAADCLLKSVVPFHEAQTMLGGIRGALSDFHSRMGEILGPDSRCALAAAEMLGGALLEDHLVEEAALLLERTLIAREALGDGQDPSLAQLLVVLALAVAATGRHDRAELYMARALELQLSCKTTDYDLLARTYADYVVVVRSTAPRLQKAKQLIQQAISIPELRDSAHRDLLLLNLSDIEMNLGLPTEAEKHARLSLEATRGPYGRGYGHWNLGYVLWIYGRYGEAQAQLLEAVEIFDVLEKPRELSAALSELAECQLRTGDLDAASQSAARSVALLEREGGGDYVNLTAAWAALAGIELARDDLEATDNLLQRAAECLTDNTRRVFPLTEVQLLYRRAQLRRRQGRGDEAQTDLGHALDILADLGGEEHALRKIILDEWERLVAEA